MLPCFQELQGRIPRDVTSQKAELFLEKISDFKFIVCLVITMRIMSVTFEVTNLLQEKELDIIKGVHLISTLHEDVKVRRSEVARSLVYKAFAILPNYIIDSVYDGKGMHWRKNVMEFATFYRDDLSNYHLLDTELSTYHTLGNFHGNFSKRKKIHLLFLKH